MNALHYLRPSRSQWRSSLAGVVCVLLPFLILAWGTAYKLSLYKADDGMVPAKVCTLGSDAAKSSIRHAVDGHKVVSRSIALSLPEILPPIARELRDDVLSPEAQVHFPLRFRMTLAARPPPLAVSLTS